MKKPYPSSSEGLFTLPDPLVLKGMIIPVCMSSFMVGVRVETELEAVCTCDSDLCTVLPPAGL